MSLSTMVSKISLVILVLFLVGGGYLVGRRCLLPIDISEGEISSDLFFLKSLSSFFAGLYPWKYLALISHVLKSSCSNAFTSASTVFLMASSQKSSSQLQGSNYTQMEDLRSFRKYQIKISLLGAVIESNFFKTTCKYSQYTTLSKTFSS